MEKYGKLDTPNITRDHLTMLMAITGFPVLAMTHILIDLCANPEHIPLLREEIERERKALTKGVLDAKALSKLGLLDSFCKESSRMNPPGLSTYTYAQSQ